MEYSKLVAVTGLPGLFELVNSKPDGGIVRSLEDNATRFISSRIHHFSHLESIEVYTVKDNVNLVDIFEAMAKGGDKLPDDKDAVAVKKYFEKVYPDLDFERVYSSDLKKMVKWYSVLKKNNVEIKLSEPLPEELPAVEVVEETPPAPKEKAKATAKTAETGKKKKEEEPVKKKPASKKK